MAQNVIDCLVPPEHLQKMTIQEERARQDGRKSRQLQDQNNKCLMLKVEVTDFVTGITRIVETQEEIVTATMESNLRR